MSSLTFEYPITLGQAKKAILECWKMQHLHNLGKVIPFLWGAPGIGKTSIISQFKKDLDKEYPGIWNMATMRLMQSDPTDLKGCPIYIKVGDRQFTTFATPEVFPLIGQPESAHGKKLILFMDELPQAPQTMQNLGANIMDGIIGDAQIDFDRCFIVAAGNRPEDRAATHIMPHNVVSRVIHYNVQPSLGELLEYGHQIGLHPVVLGYLDRNTSSLNTGSGTATGKEERAAKNAKGLAYATPRTWEMVSNFCNMWDSENKWWEDGMKKASIVGTIGTTAALDFLKHLHSNRDADLLNKIAAGLKPPIPKTINDVYTVAHEAASLINRWVDEVSDEHQLDNVSSSEGHPKWVRALGLSDRVKKINNIYDWFSPTQPEEKRVPVAAAVLLGKYQSQRAKSRFRQVLQYAPEFKVAHIAFKALQDKAKREVG